MFSCDTSVPESILVIRQENNYAIGTFGNEKQNEKHLIHSVRNDLVCNRTNYVCRYLVD